MNLTKALNQYDPDDYGVLKNFDEYSRIYKSDSTLEFDSRFEGGNLMYAFQNKEMKNNYTLFLQNDTNSNGYNQWFYFSIKNINTKCTYRFSIINLVRY